MQPHRISYAETHRFSKLVLDHVAGDPLLDEFRQFPPTRAGLLSAAGQRQFPADSRNALASALRRQYEGLDTGDLVSKNIEALGAEGLTVTTGHQLSLFMGPLYVPFKILNAIRLAKNLASELSRTVVPIFWMATEDHDRAEVDHAWINGQRVEWPGSPGGPVGRMPLQGIDSAVDHAASVLGSGPEADAIIAAMRKAYRPEHSWAKATRHFVHALFGRFGLVVVDGDDPALKRLFVPVMREEVLNGIVQRTVNYADDRLKVHYRPQAHARPMNLFHLRPGHRSRLEHSGNGVQVLDNGPRFAMEELLLDLELRPQDYSPNVLLRPVYQETILPNIAYIGGGGELAYWMQLRWLFQAVRIPMPAVLLRTSAAFVPEKMNKHLSRLGLSLQDAFLPEHAFMDLAAHRASGLDASLQQEQESLKAAFGEIAQRASRIDPTLKASTEAVAVRAERMIANLERKMARALRKHESVALDRARAVRSGLFPGDALQERRESILPLIAAHGPGVLDEILEHLDPLDQRFTVLLDS